MLRSPTPKIAPKLSGGAGSQRTLHNPMEDFPLDPKAKYGNFLDRGICKKARERTIQSIIQHTI